MQTLAPRPGPAPAPAAIATTRQAVAAPDVAAHPPLPSLALPLEWKEQPRLWGPSLHPMASYLGSFPAGLAHAFIARYTRQGDVVLDPFSGRGTTALQACAEGRIGVGNDLNPLAYLLTAAKVDPPRPDAIAARLAELRTRWTDGDRTGTIRGARALTGGTTTAGSRTALPPTVGAGSQAGVPPAVAACFHPDTLDQLCFLRAALDLDDRTDRFIAATVTGILHGRGRAFLSAIMPNTFSMPPGYVRAYAERTGFHPEHRDVFDALDTKLRHLLRHPLPGTRGIALLGDARHAGTRARVVLRERALPNRARLVVTSPPYLRVVRYGAFNWLRLWFLGFEAADVDSLLDHRRRLPDYTVFLRAVLDDMRGALTDDAVVAMVLGDVESDGGHRLSAEVRLAERAWEEAAEPLGFRLAGIMDDPIAAHRKSTRLWGAEAGRATRVDHLLVVAPTERGCRRALDGAVLPISWTWPPRGVAPTR